MAETSFFEVGERVDPWGNPVVEPGLVTSGSTFTVTGVDRGCGVIAYWPGAPTERQVQAAPVDRLDAIRAQAAAYPDGDLAWLLARHDTAQATVRELSYKLDSAGHEWLETEKERDAARADLATLRRLALDAVNAVGLCPCHDPDGDCAKIRALSDALPPEVSDA